MPVDYPVYIMPWVCVGGCVPGLDFVSEWVSEFIVKIIMWNMVYTEDTCIHTQSLPYNTEHASIVVADETL